MKATLAVAALSVVCGFLAGCGESQPAAPSTTTQKHEHIAPHGGTPVALGAEEYQVEMVLDAPAGLLQAYVLDGELENFVRIADESFEVDVKLPAREEVLIFKAVPSQATGEKVGDTSLFETRADWLKTVTNFNATLKQISVKGKTYQNAAFNFPRGNDKDETEKK